MSVAVASAPKVEEIVSGSAPAAPKARKARSKNGAPARAKPTKALLPLREIAHYHRLKTAVKQGALIQAPVTLSSFCKPLVSVEDKGDAIVEAADDE
jgi:hypothetical protein